MDTLPRCCTPTAGPTISTEDAERLAVTLKAIADPTRLRIIGLLAGGDELCVCDFVEPLGISQPTVSHHLKTLADAGIVARRKEGRWVHYRLVPERVEAIAAAVSPDPVVHQPAPAQPE